MSQQQTREKVLNQADAAAFLGVEERTLEFWRAQRRGPRFVCYSRRCVRYLESDLLAYQRQCRIETESGGSASVQ